MNETPKDFRIIALAPATRGLGFALLEGRGTLVNWGVKTINGAQKNAKVLTKVKELISHYQPDVLVLENTSAEGSRRSPRIRKLHQQILEMTKLKTKLYSRAQVLKTFLPEGKGTRHALAETIANRFPEQLGALLP